MKHVKPSELFLLRRKLIKPPCKMLLPGLIAVPRIRSEVFPGSQNYSSPGTYSFTVPNFNSLSIDVAGAGGGGSGSLSASAYGTAGGGGSYSQFYNGSSINVVGYGGNGGAAPGYNERSVPAAADGTGANGDTNYTGGGAACGVAGHQHLWWGAYDAGYFYGGNGGRGGRAQRTFLPSVLIPGSIITVIVGSGGVAGVNGWSSQDAINGYSLTDVAQPTAGVGGSVQITWS